MKNSTPKNPDTFQHSVKTLRALIAGSNMAKISTIILIAISLKLMFYSEKDVLVIISLSMGIITLIVYISKFLILKNVRQKSYTQIALNSSILKLKWYMTQRKNKEIYYISIWAISIIPIFSILIESTANACVSVIIGLVMMNFFGRLGFNKTDKTLRTLENAVHME